MATTRWMHAKVGFVGHDPSWMPTTRLEVWNSQSEAQSAAPRRMPSSLSPWISRTPMLHTVELKWVSRYPLHLCPFKAVNVKNSLIYCRWPRHQMATVSQWSSPPRWISILSDMKLCRDAGSLLIRMRTNPVYLVSTLPPLSFLLFPYILL